MGEIGGSKKKRVSDIIVSCYYKLKKLKFFRFITKIVCHKNLKKLYDQLGKCNSLSNDKQNCFKLLGVPIFIPPSISTDL